ncbi:MAG: VOC family protein [Bacteroidota bacterium]
MTGFNAYLTFNGNCEEAFLFYKSVLGGEIPYIGRFSEMPPMEGAPPMTEEMGKRVMHMSLDMGNGMVLMGSDTGGEWAANFSQGTNFSLSINAESNDEVDRLFAGLSEGGVAVMPPNSTFWGSYFSMCADKFGINWMVSFEMEKPMES